MQLAYTRAGRPTELLQHEGFPRDVAFGIVDVVLDKLLLVVRALPPKATHTIHPAYFRLESLFAHSRRSMLTVGERD